MWGFGVDNSRYLFDHLDELNEFKNDPDTAIITDIDGTISEIAPTPMEAVVKPEIRDIIEKIADKFKFTGVMTGRSINNAMEMVGSKKIIYIGNHGLEQYKNGKISIEPQVKPYIPVIKKLAKEIQKKLKDYECILFQDKELSFTVHYRLCKTGDEIRQKALEIIHSIKSSKSLKITEGRKVIEIRPPVGHDKGTVLQKFISDNHIKKIVYLGDDVTDADAFNKLNELKRGGKAETVSIMVDSKETPDYVKESADFYVKSVDEVCNFFKWFLEG